MFFQKKVLTYHVCTYIIVTAMSEKKKKRVERCSNSAMKEILEKVAIMSVSDDEKGRSKAAESTTWYALSGSPSQLLRCCG